MKDESMDTTQTSNQHLAQGMPAQPVTHEFQTNFNEEVKCLLLEMTSNHVETFKNLQKMCDVLQGLTARIIKLEEEVQAIKMANDIKGGPG